MTNPGDASERKPGQPAGGSTKLADVLRAQKERNAQQQAAQQQAVQQAPSPAPAPSPYAPTDYAPPPQQGQAPVVTAPMPPGYGPTVAGAPPAGFAPEAGYVPAPSHGRPGDPPAPVPVPAASKANVLPWIVAGVLGVFGAGAIGAFAFIKGGDSRGTGGALPQSVDNNRPAVTLPTQTATQQQRAPSQLNAPAARPAQTQAPTEAPAPTPTSTAAADRPEGFPDEVPRQRTKPPNVKEWASAPTVKMQPEGCFRKVVREWMKLNCSKSETNNPGAQGFANVEAFGSNNADYFSWVRAGEVADIVVRMSPGKRAVATMQLDGQSLQVGYDWSSDGPYPTPVWE